MAGSSSIEWTDATWNPVSGCSKVSPGCAHCYAETVADRFWTKQYPPIPVSTPEDLDATNTLHRPRKFTDVLCHADRLDQPLRWRKPRRIFVNSMSDLFHESVPDAFIVRVFAVMALAPQHTFQVLTKRAERMRDLLTYYRPVSGPPPFSQRVLRAASNVAGYEIKGLPWPLPNVWLGVSVENQRFADERIPLLLQTPAAVRFISAEPLLGAVDLQRYLRWNFDTYAAPDCRLDWVIVGGESGPGARPFDVAWARSIVQECKAAGVPVFVKQLGSVPVMGHLEWMTAPRTLLLNHVNDRHAPQGSGRVPLKLFDRKGGDPQEWPQDLRVREFPTATAEGRP